MISSVASRGVQMPSRRTLLATTLASAAAGLAAPVATFAAVVPSRSARVALVIGNDRYAQHPLRNAGNDARAMAELLKSAGFRVDLRVDATLRQMSDAIDALGRAAIDPGVGTTLFYYAGHAAQVEWRNYLLPVDGDVASASDVRRQCVDLGLLLGRLGRTRGKTSLIILDACRSDPFGAHYRPSEPGMSQYDAPAGSLLAFATSPGRTAVELPGSDHGLYTENLIRELSVRGARIEDALKRVRLSVRLASRGAQVPWESTSLENDVYLFPAPTLTDAEVERRFRDEYANWTRIKTSGNPNDWIDYLRTYPDGKFAEVAQVHLTRLLSADQTPVAKKSDASATALRIGPGIAVPERFRRPPRNPNSAGTYPFRPVWTPGDEYVFQEMDLYSKVVQRTIHLVVKRVDLAGNRVELADGSVIDLTGGVLREGTGRHYDLPIQINPSELQVGRKWSTRYEQSGAVSGFGDYEFRVKARETVKVPAGEFSAFRIEGLGWFARSGTGNQRLHMVRWLVPGINFAVRREQRQTSSLRVLVSVRQAVSN